MSAVVHIHILESIGLGGLESRLEAIRLLDQSVEHVIAVPSGWQHHIPKYWGGGVVSLPINPNLECTYSALVNLHEFLAELLCSYPRSVIHTHTPLPAIAVASAPSMMRSVHVHTIHGPIWIPWSGKGKRVFHEVISKLVDRMIAVSKEVEERAISAGVMRRLLTISNVSATVPNSTPRAQQETGSSILKAAFAARLDHGKCEGILELVDRIKDHPDKFSLDIFGDGPLLHDVTKRARQVAANVQICGADPWFMYRIPEYDLIVGEGRVVLEALSVGRSALVCGAELATFATSENMDALTYANCTARGLKNVLPPSVAELLNPPAPPPLPAAPSIANLNSYLAIRSTRATVERLRFVDRFANLGQEADSASLNVIDMLDKLEQESGSWPER